MDAWAALGFVVFLLPFLGFALVALYVGYVAYEAREARARPKPALGPDPALELEAVNTELARSVTQARLSLDAARDAIRKGVR